MNVVLINHSDSQGGAAIVSLRLIHALLRAGITARMLVIDRQDLDVYAQPMGNSVANRWRFLAERLGIYLRNGRRRDTLFQIDTCSRGYDVTKHPWVKDADVVMLAWVNQGTLSLRGIEKIGRKLHKPLVWVMHDMWNCTGVCHYAFSCDRFTGTCQDCPLLPGKGRDLSTRTQQRKARLYGRVPITFVAVSHWLQGECRKSSLLRDQDVRVIYNAFPIREFDYHRLPDDDGFLGLPAGKKIVIMGARRLDVEVKGFKELIETTQYISQHRPELAERLHLLLYGDISDQSLLGQIALPCTWAGTVQGNDALSELYRHSDILLSTALYENLPGTLIEGQASGCIPVTFGRGGQTDIVDHLRSGYIAAYQSPESVADGLEWAASQPVSREFLHQEVARKFDADAIAAQFIELFNEITA